MNYQLLLNKLAEIWKALKSGVDSVRELTLSA